MTIIPTLPQTSTESAILACSPLLEQHRTMDDLRTAQRRVVADVERVLDRFVSERGASALRSTIALLVINETRVDRKTAVRKELHSKPEPPRVLNLDGTLMRRVAPLRDVAQIVKVKHRAASGTNELSNARLAYLNVASILGRLQRSHSGVLLACAAARIEIKRHSTFVRIVGVKLGSATQRRRFDRQQLATLKLQRDEAEREKTTISATLKRIVRTRTYRDACASFDLQCELKGTALSELFPRRNSE